MENNMITNSIFYIGANDRNIDLFEGQYKVANGISYNSYLIKDEKNVIMDTIDKNATEEWIQKLELALNGEKPDYLVVSHLEPDHSYNIELICKKYPEMKIVGNAKTFAFIPQFFNIENLDERKVEVKEGDSLNIGKHTLNFIMAPMVHWPEVMFTYEQTEKILFSADAFGKFGDLNAEEEWLDEARRYYINIVGKYGIQVQAILKKASTLDIEKICPLHGPILTENLEYYINKYDIWSSYRPEEDGILIAYSSIYGNTANAAKILEGLLKDEKQNVVIKDLARCDMAEAISDAFKYSKIVLASSSYNFGLFPPMENFLNQLKLKNFQNRKVGIIENGTWAPSAAKVMNEIISQMKDIELLEPSITIRTKMNDENLVQMKELVKSIIKA